MAILRTALGLDVGSHSIKAVEVAQSLRGLGAVRVQSEPRAGREVPEVLRELIGRHGLHTEHVVTAVPGDRVSVRRLEFPFGEKRRVAQAVPFEIEDQLPFDLEDVLVDWELIHRERSRSEVLAVVAPRSEVSRRIEELHEAGCDPHIIECEGLALANLTAAFDLGGSRVLVDLGHSKTTLCVLVNGRAVASRSISTAGLALTRALAEDRGLDLEEAERIKCEEGVIDASLGVPLPKVAAMLDRIAHEIVRMVTSLESIVRGDITEVTLMGGTAQLDHLDELLAARTDLATRRIGLPRREAGIALVAGGSPVVFAPTIALALRGTARAVTDFNFRQDEFSRPLDLSFLRRDFGATGILAAIVAALAVLSFATGTLLDSRRAGVIEKQIAVLYGDALPEGQDPDNALGALREAVRDANERAEFLGVYRGNLSALDLLTEISRRVPPDLDVVFEELSIDRQTVRIRVYTESFEAAERLGQELAKFGPFANARVGAIETDRRTGRKKFNVTISLAENQA